MALVHSADKRLKAWPGLARTLYFSTASDDDIGHAVEVLQAALRSKAPQGVTWFYQSWPDLHHSSIYPGASPMVLRKLFPPK